MPRHPRCPSALGRGKIRARQAGLGGPGCSKKAEKTPPPLTGRTTPLCQLAKFGTGPVLAAPGLQERLIMSETRQGGSMAAGPDQAPTARLVEGVPHSALFALKAWLWFQDGNAAA